MIEKGVSSAAKEMLSSNYKTGSILNSLSDWSNDNIFKPAQEMEAFLKNKYGIKTSNVYLKHEYFSTAKKKIKTIESGLTGQVEELRKILVNPAEDLKEFINEFIGNVINCLKNLSYLFDQGAMAELKILGEILQLTHLIRLIRVIIKMIEEGIDGCKDFNKNKLNKEILKETIENINSKLSVDLTDETEKTDREIATISSKNNKYKHTLNDKSCNELSKSVESDNSNLDLIYSSLKDALV